MGGLSGVLEGMGKGLQDWGEKLLQKTVATPAARTAWSLAGVKQDIFQAFPEGKIIGALHASYFPASDNILGKLEAPRAKLFDGISKRTDYMTQRLAEKPMEEIHSTLLRNKDPLAVHSQAILDSNLNEAGETLNGKVTLAQLGFKNRQLASAQARMVAFGPNMSYLAPAITALKKSADPVKNSYADLLMDVISNDTRDLSTFKGAPVSDVKMRIRDYIEQENKANTLLAKSRGQTPKDIPLPKTAPTYSSTGELERAIRTFTIIRQAPFAAFSHALMPVNLVISSPLSAVVKGLITMNTPELKALREASGYLFQTQHAILNDRISAATGLIQHKTGNLRVANFIQSAFHMPGLNWIRTWQMSLAGATGYHSAIMWGEAAVKGDKEAILQLKGLGLNPEGIVKRGGKLSDEELKQAVYNFADDRMFINRAKFASLHSNANPFMRSASTFHGFINAQSNFMQRQLLLMLKAGDYKGIAKTAAVLGVAYPMVAPLIKSLGVLGRTANPGTALQSASDDYKHLSSPDNVEEFARTYIEMLSYIGGLGMAHSYIQGAWGDRLALTVLGPTFGAGVRTAQDAINGATKPNNSGKHNFKPLGRDLLDNSIPIIGKELEHQLLPTDKESR
jgi:hypothetical protein